MAPLFFLSYAREDGSSRYFAEFAEMLRESVRVKCGLPPSDVAFQDTEAIALGEEWPEKLATALQQCRVFVPIYSPTYFSKPFCGKEWAFFRLRQREHAVANGTNALPPLVVPVLWSAKRYLPTSLPEDLLDLQFAAGEAHEAYARKGLDVLMRQSTYDSQRVEVIETIADRILEAADLVELPPLQPAPSIREVQELFPAPAVATPVAGGRPTVVDPAAEGGPRFVRLVVVAATRQEFETAAPAALRRNRQYYGQDEYDWNPYHPEEVNRAGAIANEIASKLNFLPAGFLPANEELVEQLKAAERANQIVVLLVDSWTLRIERYRDMMEKFDGNNYRNAVVMVLWDGDPETTSARDALDEVVRLAFSFRSANTASRLFVSPVASAADFRRNLAEALEAARRGMREHAELKRGVVIRPRPTFG